MFELCVYRFDEFIPRAMNRIFLLSIIFSIGYAIWVNKNWNVDGFNNNDDVRGESSSDVNKNIILKTYNVIDNVDAENNPMCLMETTRNTNVFRQWNYDTWKKCFITTSSKERKYSCNSAFSLHPIRWRYLPWIAWQVAFRHGAIETFNMRTSGINMRLNKRVSWEKSGIFPNIRNRAIYLESCFFVQIHSWYNRKLR